ncbi:hypothetical protein AK812_SmicGene47308, partial [Symbiodinium microadriaticum]
MPTSTEPLTAEELHTEEGQVAGAGGRDVEGVSDAWTFAGA